jgi:hypothetical protein
MARLDRRSDFRVDVYANTPRVRFIIVFAPEEEQHDEWRSEYNRIADQRRLSTDVAETEGQTVLSVYILDVSREFIAEALEAAVQLIEDVNSILQPKTPTDAELIGLLERKGPEDLWTVETLVNDWWEGWKPTG